ncbi:hypothetical protein AMS68_000253 [Peltaster fructicola]|uniref:Uncharacterized protein n=1 Tax=Peltaster fructicola TaxID=286661 RepID=A0A6H0XJ44_9PEZI|nr:hypothetical protein AMS68_000253 [Peltaster fructicola]
MDFLRSVRKRLPSGDSLPTLNNTSKPAKVSKSTSEKSSSKLAWFQRRIRIRRNSKISIPLYAVVLFPTIILILVLFLFLRHPNSPGGSFLPNGSPPAVRKISEKHDKVFVSGCLDPATQINEPRVNGAFVVLARNKELPGVIDSLKSVERHFNRWFHYPYVFLNNEEFNSTFKETVMNYTSSTVEFGKIPKEHWNFPDWVDPKVAKEGIARQGDAAIMYGGMESYHQMCRFYSGYFYKHELLQKYDWYWRVEPDIKYYCDLTYDPFRYMEQNNKTYGFTIAVKELKETVPNIWRYASAYKRANNLTSKGLWEMFVEPTPEDLKKKELPKDDPKHAKDGQKPLPEDIMRTEPGQGSLDIDPDNMEGESYNMCHFWSNFEIARLDFFRSKAYEDFFQMMDRSGGFWMERWGDAPIHSLAAGALLATNQIHYFRDIGYRHTTIHHCPVNAPARQLPHIQYPGTQWEQRTYETNREFAKTFDEEEEYWSKWDTEKENGVGCRCRCDTDIVDVENKEGSCIPEWVDVAGGYITPEGPGK